MNADLRSALHDLAEGQEFRPDPDAWDRGRRARRRSRVVAGVAALGVVAVVAGVGALVTGTPQGLAPADRDVVPDGAIPSRIEEPPAGLDKETELAIGLGSAAFVSSSDDPVVIGAVDGEPHVLDLPEWDQSHALALSPDGRRLAWQPALAGDPVPKVALLDLVTGEVTRVQLGGGGEIDLRSLSWSPDSSSVAGLGHSVTELGPGMDWLCRVDTATATGLLFGPIDSRARHSDIATVSEGGDLLVRTADRELTLFAGGQKVSLDVRKGLGAGAFSPTGDLVALRAGPSQASYTLDVERDRVLAHPFPTDTRGPSLVRPLGWLDDRLQLLAVAPADGSSDTELVVATPEIGETSTWRGSVGSIAPGVHSLSLAVDLVPDLDGSSSQELTHDFGESEGIGERDISWVIGLGVAAAIAVLMGLRWLWRRVT